MSQKNRRKTVKKASRWQLNAAWHARLRGMGMVLFGLGCLTAAGSAMNHALSIRHWDVESSDPFIRQTIEKQLSRMQPLDFLQSQPRRLRNRLLATLPDLADVRIARYLPHRLNISASARRPVAMWQQTGVMKLVDINGRAYVTQRVSPAWDLPVLRVDQQQLHMAAQLLEQLRQADPRQFSKLSECKFLSPDTWALYFEGGQRWLLPHGALTGKRMHALLAMLKKPQWQSWAWQVDARLSTRWFFRQANKYGGAI